MESAYLLVIDIFCIILGIVGLFIPAVAFGGIILCVGLLLSMVITGSIIDANLLTFTIITIILDLFFAIVGFRRNN